MRLHDFGMLISSACIKRKNDLFEVENFLNIPVPLHSHIRTHTNQVHVHRYKPPTKGVPSLPFHGKIVLYHLQSQATLPPASKKNQRKAKDIPQSVGEWNSCIVWECLSVLIPL